MAMGRDGTPGSAGLHLAADVPLLHPGEQVFAAMLDGWRAQQLARNLALATAGGREAMVRAFAAHADAMPWTWGPQMLDEWLGELRAVKGLRPDGRLPMRADNTRHIVAATRQRHELTRAKAIQALRTLDAEGAPVTFEIVARAASVPGPGSTPSPIFGLRSSGSAMPSGELPRRLSRPNATGIRAKPGPGQAIHGYRE